MPSHGPTPIPFPLSSFPGGVAQESAGRLINCYSEPLGDPQQNNYGAPQDGIAWRRLPGLTQFSLTGQNGYRGGIEAAGTSYEAFANEAVALSSGGISTNLGLLPGTAPMSMAINQNATSPDVVAVDPVQGAFVLFSAVNSATVLATVSGASVAGDTVSLIFTNPQEVLAGTPGWPITATTAALGGGLTTVQIATALVTAVNANATCIANGVSASNVGGTSNVITLAQVGSIGNSTTVTGSKTGTGSENVAFSNGGVMTGGTGVFGTFVPGGPPVHYTGQGNLPAVNSVAFQDGYFFFTVSDGRVFASGLNALTQNALTFVKIQAKADVTLLRGIPYQGYMFFFTTGSIEIWNDAANPAPNFPYGRNAILAYGLIQGSAIAGFETGFDDLLWVAQDYGVYRLVQGSLAPSKVSPPDLDRAIEKAVNAGDTLQASVYIFAGKKVWVLSSSSWTWQFHLNSQKWFERGSLQPNGSLGSWRGVGGHLAFGKWLMGDAQTSTAIVYVDDQNPFEIVYQNSTTWVTTKLHMLMRIESGMVDKFPVRARVPRADFHFVQGVGVPVAQMPLSVTGTSAGAVSGAGNLVRLAVVSTLGVNSGDQIQVFGVGGTTEANGVWTGNTIDATHIDLLGTVFVHPYTFGGSAIDLSIEPDMPDPTVAISWSDDGGNSWRPPVLRHLGQVSVVKTGRITAKNTGKTGHIGRRWRLDVSAPVYTSFLRGSQSDEPTLPQ